MLNHFTSCMKLQKGGAKQSGVSMVGVFLMVAASLLMKALLVQLSWEFSYATSFKSKIWT